MNKPLLNILIRTSDRPNYFNRLLSTIHSQTFQGHNLIIGADTPETREYVSGKGYVPVMVNKRQIIKKYNFPYNLYLNDLLKEVKEGWVMFMDDDDIYADENVFQTIVDNLPDEDTMLVVKMQFPGGREVPEDKFWGRTPFIASHIGMPCFIFHSKWKDKINFIARRGGDYRVSNQLIRAGIKTKWLKYIAVKLTNKGNKGRKIDL